MKPAESNRIERELGERLATSGFRFTSQRRCVYDVLLHKRDHPTAEEVFTRAKKAMPEISHATVYNCLDALVSCGLARQVHLERGATRDCPHMETHCHFFCDKFGYFFISQKHEIFNQFMGIFTLLDINPKWFTLVIKTEFNFNTLKADCTMFKFTFPQFIGKLI